MKKVFALITLFLFFLGCTQNGCVVNDDCKEDNAPCMNYSCETGKCISKAVQDGTNCGEGKECFLGECVKKCNIFDCDEKDRFECNGTTKQVYNYSCKNEECISELKTDENSIYCGYIAECNETECTSKNIEKCVGTTKITETFYCDQKEGCTKKTETDINSLDCGWADKSKLILGQTHKFEKMTLNFNNVEYEAESGNKKPIRIILKLKNISSDLIKVSQYIEDFEADAGWYEFTESITTNAQEIEQGGYYYGDKMVMQPNEEIILWVTLKSDLSIELIREAKLFTGNLKFYIESQGEEKQTISTKIIFTQEQIQGNKETSCESLLETCNGMPGDAKKSCYEFMDLENCSHP
ncbi:MAG: hypothetical protein ABH986_03665 [archaeon]